MAFVLPTFPFQCNIYNWQASGVPASLRLTVDCQLRGPNPSYAASAGIAGGTSIIALVLLPAGTDVRDAFNPPINSPDFIEVPAGSGRWYTVRAVDDIGKGFPNEHRFAAVIKYFGAGWPTPIP